MSSTVLKLMLLLGIIGHACNMYCDRILSIFPNGQLKLENFKDLTNEEKMAHLLEGVSPKIPMRSAILGAFSLFLQFLGYFSLSAYIWTLQTLRRHPFCYYADRGYRYRYRSISALGCYFHHITDIYPAVSISDHRYFTYCCDGFHACLADPDIKSFY